MPQPLTRRGFLGQTAAAGAALAVWSEVPARASDSPNERIAVAVMGTNNRGSDLARGFGSHPGSVVTCICDVDEAALGKGLAAAAKVQTLAPRPLGDFRVALDDPSVDVLAIAAPDHWHAPATILACAAGKHVYVEKPASHNGREGQLMVAAARTNQRVVQLGTQRRSSAGVIEAVGRLRAGEIGRVLFARGWINSQRPSIGHGKPAPVPSHLNYELWQGPAPERPYVDNLIHYHWHWFWHWGTGELGNNGIHALDVCRWGLGVDYPEHVVCGGGRYHFDDDQETPDTQLATFHFGDKAITWEHRTWSKRGFEGEGFGEVFYGEKGSLVIGAKGYKMFDAEGELLAEGGAGYSDADHIGDFLACIKSGGRPKADIEEGVKSTTLCHLGNIAYRTGRTVKFDPATQTIVGDDEAAGLWSRAYRAGWEPKV
ncbi:MAG TPA: Gfo/Idh/MocA family oxidoreductase [Pirellulales bacterium]|jgi:predicted dehydrogenase|nr:Gfo/Idh/MocA family oxidoreductase [Pirellulales bacterium]